MKLYIFAFLFLIFNGITAQKKEYLSIKKGEFPEGIYMTLEEVLQKTPSSAEDIYFKTAVKNDAATLPDKVFFYDKQDDRKIRKPLAVSYKGEMYFQTFRKYTNKEDKTYEADVYSRFCKVLSYGRFLYFEESVRSIWNKGLLSELNSLTQLISGNNKGIVLDLKNKELNIFRDCDDFNDFLFEHEIPSAQCDPDRFTLKDLRKKIDELNASYQ
ncbi:hypothetical protein [Chryseobacterium sp.]|uniref:hypothetical protein n=1 Tax=Chryseobacterium sp. TaxID=1871047 RepID=UPI0025BB6F82|nr:hypothetical protein [Chryseobacterium sp.]MBV8328022.1 hypothetical protein [Chryseobacterium sp.]